MKRRFDKFYLKIIFKLRINFSNILKENGDMSTTCKNEFKYEVYLIISLE